MNKHRSILHRPNFILLVAWLVLALFISNVRAGTLFSDNFDSGVFPGTNWSVTGAGNAAVNNRIVNSAPNSLEISADETFVTSSVIDASGSSSMQLDVWIARGLDGTSENPDAGEDLEVQYFDITNTWVTLETFPGTGTQGETFIRSYNLPVAAQHANFRIRFHLVTASGFAGFDFWHVDDVVVSDATAASCDFNSGLISGLPGDYFNNMTLTAPVSGTRVDGPVDFDWGGGSPGVAGVGNNNFSVRWDGVVRVTTTDMYRFQTVSDDGVRLYVDNVLVIDNWTDHAATTDTSANVALTAGEVYDVRLEFYENGGQAVIRLRWGRSGTGFSYTAIPAGPSPVYGEGLYYCTSLSPVAEWRMDETSWNGTAGEVVDETGSFNGTALNGATTASTSPAIAGDPGTCGYGDFPFNSSAAPPVAVDTGVNIDTDVGNAGTITLWYKSNVNWNGGGDRSILDAANAAAAGGAKYFFLTLLNNGQLRFGFEDTADGDYRINTPAQPNAANTWVHLAVTWDLPGDSLAIFVNGSQAASGTPNTNGALGQLKTLYVGDNNGEYIISGDTTANSANGSIDEVRIYDSVLTASEITTIMNETHACAVTPAAATIYLSTDSNETLGGLSFEDGDLVEYDAATDTTTSPPYFDESANPPGITNINMDAAHLLDGNNLVFSTTNNETIDGFNYEDGDLILYDYATDTFSEFFSEDFFSGNADIDAVYVISHSATQSVFLLSVDGNETIGGNSFSDGDIFQVIYDRTGGTVTTSIVLDESIYGTNVDVDAVHLLNTGNYVLSMDNNETIDGFAYEDGDLIEYDPIGDVFSEFLSEDLFSGNADINAVTDLPSITLDHYDIDISPATGITCLPVTVTITAKDATNTTFVHTSATTINLATSTGLGTWGTASVGAVTNVVAGAGTADYQFAIGQSTVDIELNYPVLAGAAPETVNINITSTPNETTGVAIPAEDDPSVDFYTAGLIYNNVTAGNNTIPTQISGKDSSIVPGAATLNIQAVRASDNDPSVCQSIFSNGAVVSINLGAECKNPVQCEGNQLNITNSAPATSGGVNIATSDNDSNPQTVAAYSAVDLQFGASSEATIVLNYPDAGLMQLHARYELLLDDGTPSGEYAIGISNDFVVKPAGLCVESTDAGSDCASGDQTCSIFRKAGALDAENFFNLTVRGVTWETAGETNDQFCTGTNVTTPNFELNSITLGHSLVAPSGVGTQSGTLGVTSVDIVDADIGTKTTSTQSITEVGVFTITATPPAYLGETIAVSSSANIGRFIPDRFNVTMQNTPAFADACTGFTYQDQPFYYDDIPTALAPVLQVTALNSDGVTTNNYGGSFWKLTGGSLDRDYSDGSGTPPAASFSPSTTQSGGFTLAGDTDFDGIGTLTLNAGSSGDEFMYQKGIPLDTPEEPFDADVDVTFAASGFQDADHNPPTRTVCYDSNNDNTCEAFSYNMIQGTELRWGRLLVGNAFGSELLPLSAPLTAQYFSGSLFQTNTLDNCTTYQSGDGTLSDVSGADNLAPGDTSISSPVASTGLVNGVSVTGSHLTVDAPGAGKTGSLDLTLDLSAATGSDQEWLRFDGADPVGRLTFGIYNGPDEFIYMREPW